jgi:hypothetical protein
MRTVTTATATRASAVASPTSACGSTSVSARGSRAHGCVRVRRSSAGSRFPGPSRLAVLASTLGAGEGCRSGLCCVQAQSQKETMLWGGWGGGLLQSCATQLPNVRWRCCGPQRHAVITACTPCLQAHAAAYNWQFSSNGTQPSPRPPPPPPPLRVCAQRPTSRSRSCSSPPRHPRREVAVVWAASGHERLTGTAAMRARWRPSRHLCAPAFRWRC